MQRKVAYTQRQALLLLVLYDGDDKRCSKEYDSAMAVMYSMFPKVATDRLSKMLILYQYNLPLTLQKMQDTLILEVERVYSRQCQGQIKTALEEND